MSPKAFLRTGLVLLSSALILSGCFLPKKQPIDLKQEVEEYMAAPSVRTDVSGEDAYRAAVDLLRDRNFAEAALKAGQAAERGYPGAEDLAADLLFITAFRMAMVEVYADKKRLNEVGNIPGDAFLRRDVSYAKCKKRIEGMPVGKSNLEVFRYLFRQYLSALGDLTKNHREFFESEFTIKHNILANKKKPALIDADIDKILRGEKYSPAPLSQKESHKNNLRTCIANYGYTLAVMQWELDMKLWLVGDTAVIRERARHMQKEASYLCAVCNRAAELAKENPNGKFSSPKETLYANPSKPEERDWLNMQPLQLMRTE